MRNQVLGNRYRILSLIGEGGMASVYKAQDMKLERRVAIKVLHSHLAQNNDIRSRFQQEAKALSGLEHPNVLKVYDFSGAESKQLWIVMEILKGQSLADFVRNFPKSALHPILAAIITQEVCKALAQAHTQGIVHRDVKPDNIMVLDDGRIKLMDFGIAKDVKNHSMTMTGTFMGSPSYMSPEQIRGRDIDHRSDIYSLGVMLYEIITGVLPFTGGSTADVINKIIVGKYMEPAQVINGVPPELNAMVVKAMAQEPYQRQQKIDEILEELSRFLSKHGFVESHIELERFFRDRATFESRLRKLHFSSGRVRSATHANESSYRAATTQALPHNTPTELITPQQSSARQTAVQTTTTDRSTRYSTTRATQYTQQTRVERTAVTDRRRLKHPLRVGRRATDEARDPIERLTGIGIVLAMAVAALISFVTFTRVFEPAEQEPVVNEPIKPTPVETKPEAKKEAAPVETPVETKTDTTTATTVDPKVTTKPADTPAPAPNKTTTKPKVEAKKQRPSTRPETTRIPPKATATTQPAAPVTATMTTTQPTAPSQTKTTPVPPAHTTATPAPTEQAAPTPKTPAVTYAQLTILSQPAAEIFVDGKAYGTTNDPENRRRGVRLNPGAHRLELKRRGYTTLTRSVQVEAGDTRTMNFKLEKESLTRFSVTTNKSPAKLTIEEKGGNFYRKELNITRDSISVNLPPGTYRIRVEFGSQIMERNVTLTPGREALTFTAEFKEE